MYLNYNSSKICIQFMFWGFHETNIAGTQYLKNFDRDNFKICLLPGFGAQNCCSGHGREIDQGWTRIILPLQRLLIMWHSNGFAVDNFVEEIG